METKGSSPNLKQHVTCPYLQPAQPSPLSLTLFPEATIYIIFTSTINFSKWPLSPRFLDKKTPYTPPLYPLRATWPAPLILLDLIT